MQLFEHLEQSQDSTIKIVSSTNVVIYLGFKFSTTNPRYFLLPSMTEFHKIWNKETELFQRGKALFLCMGVGDSLNYNRNNFSSSLQSVINKFNWSVITLLSCDLLLDIFHIRLSQILANIGNIICIFRWTDTFQERFWQLMKNNKINAK